MNIIDRYLWKNVLLGVLMAWLALLILDLFFSFLGELGDIAKFASYSTSDAAVYLGLTAPRRLYDFFPTAILIGSLLGLGGLAAHSEFTAMRAAGLSIMQITFAVLKLGLVMVFVTYLAGQWVVIKTDRMAKTFKAAQKNKQITFRQDESMWIKEKNEIIYIGKVEDKNHLKDIRIYRMGENREKLGDLSFIESATFENNGWTLFNTTTHHFLRDSVKKIVVANSYTNTLLNNNILGVVAITPDLLSTQELQQVIEHQEANGLNVDKYKLEYWKHFSVPLSALVMLILAIPFLFGSQRSGSTGQRVFIGLIVGISFFLINRALNELGVVYAFPPVVSAFLPLAVFLLMGVWGISRIR